MKVLAVIQARMGSTRLPGKVGMQIEGRTVIEHVIDRVSAVPEIDDVVVATTLDKKDLPIVGLCAKLGVRVFCGSENDVLDRFYQAARVMKPHNVVRITADCPLIDPKIASHVIRRHLEGVADYTSNVIEPTFPDGEDVEAFTYDTLLRAWNEAKLQSEREHVTQYIIKNPIIFKLNNITQDRDLSSKRWTLDTQEDYSFIETIYARLYSKDHFFGMNEILSLLDREPEIENKNKIYRRNEGLAKSISNDEKT